MPLHKIEWSGPRSGWAVWHITESESTLRTLALPDSCPDEIHSSSKKAEWMAGRILLKYLLDKAGLPYKGLRKDIHGKPFLEGYPHPISLSHSFPYVAFQLDENNSVGIDIEQPKSKLLRIAPRILNPTERQDAGDDIVKNCIYWCAKESLYKIYGQRGLTFAEHLPVQPFVLGREGQLTGNIFMYGSDRLIKLGYCVEQDFVLVYTKPQQP